MLEKLLLVASSMKASFAPKIRLIHTLPDAISSLRGLACYKYWLVYHIMKDFLAHLDEPISVDGHISCKGLATRQLPRRWACLAGSIVETAV